MSKYTKANAWAEQMKYDFKEFLDQQAYPY